MTDRIGRSGIARESRRRLALALVVSTAAGVACAEPASVRTSVEYGVQAAGENQLFWTLSDRFAAEARYDPDRS